jgi:capsular polysaccharide biosynthesis protein
LLVGSPANARWAARFALSAGIDFDVPPTGLLALTVWRPDQPTAPGPVLLPVLERDGSVVTARQGTETIPMPSSRWLNLESARIQCGGIVTVDNKLVLYEEAADPSHDFVANYEGILFGSRANPSQALLAPFPPAAESIDEGILLAGRNDTNWYHWLIEYLPRVLEIPQDIGQAVPLLVSAGTPASGLDALRSLSDREVVLIDPGLSQEVSRLHVLAPPVQIVDSTRVSWDSGLLVNPGPLCKARQVWRQDAAAPSRLIFLRRRSRHRGMGNQLALERIAVSMGLEVVDPSDLTWDEQREIFTTAKLVVGASGAVMANYLLMPSGGRVLALTSELLDGFILPAVIAGICGVDFTYLLGPATDSLEKFTHRREWFHGDFTVDADAFRAVLGSELQRVPLHQNPS